MNNLAVLRQLQTSQIEALRLTRNVVENSPLTTLFHHHNDLCWFNQTVPTGPAADEDIEQTEKAYALLGREPFFEFCQDLNPGLKERLQARGYETLLEAEIMIHNPSLPVPTSIATALTYPDLEEFSQAGSLVYNTPQQPPTPDDKARAKAAFESGLYLAAIIKREGKIVSFGQAVGTAEVREVAGLGTLEEYRRQGLASQVVNKLLADFYKAEGKIAWLTPADDHARGIYERLGFEIAGSSAHMLLKR